jgi:hypothetical protein
MSNQLEFDFPDPGFTPGVPTQPLTRLEGRKFILDDKSVRQGDRLHVRWPSGVITTEKVLISERYTTGDWRSAGWPDFFAYFYSEHNGYTQMIRLNSEWPVAWPTEELPDLSPEMAPVEYCFTCAWEQDGCICE